MCVSCWILSLGNSSRHGLQLCHNTRLSGRWGGPQLIHWIWQSSKQKELASNLVWGLKIFPTTTIFSPAQFLHCINTLLIKHNQWKIQDYFNIFWVLDWLYSCKYCDHTRITFFTNAFVNKNMKGLFNKWRIITFFSLNIDTCISRWVVMCHADNEIFHKSSQTNNTSPVLSWPEEKCHEFAQGFWGMPDPKKTS